MFLFFIDLRERERNINQLLPILAPTGNQTCNLLLYRVMLQPTEPLARSINEKEASVLAAQHSWLDHSPNMPRLQAGFLVRTNIRINNECIFLPSLSLLSSHSQISQYIKKKKSSFSNTFVLHIVK